MHFENAIPFDRKQHRREVPIVPKTLTQEKYLLALNDDSKNIVVAYGPAGTGKTYLAMQVAVKALRTGICSKLILTRPAVAVEEEDLGFLPGTVVEKMTPWSRPLFDVLHEYYSPKEVATMIEYETIEISPLAYMRGRSFKDSLVIADEMQNSTVNQMKMLLTRLGSGSKIVVTGDLDQRDRKFADDNGLEDIVKRVDSSYVGNRISMVKYSCKDIQRHPAVTDILNLYNK